MLQHFPAKCNFSILACMLSRSLFHSKTLELLFSFLFRDPFLTFWQGCIGREELVVFVQIDQTDFCELVDGADFGWLVPSWGW